MKLIPADFGSAIVDHPQDNLYRGIPRSCLLEHLREGDIPGVERFRYAEHRSVEEAQETEEELIEELG